MWSFLFILDFVSDADLSAFYIVYRLIDSFPLNQAEGLVKGLKFPSGLVTGVSDAGSWHEAVLHCAPCQLPASDSPINKQERNFLVLLAAHITCVSTPRARKFFAEAYKRHRSPSSQDSASEYLLLLDIFCQHYGLPLCFKQPRCLHLGSWGEQADLFLDFAEALVVRFVRKWHPCREPFRPGAKQMMSSADFQAKKIGQWAHQLGRTSLVQFKNAPFLFQFFFILALAHAHQVFPKLFLIRHSQLLNQHPHGLGS